MAAMEKARTRPKQATASATVPRDKIEVEPGFEKRLSDIYKKALNAPPPRKQTDKPQGKKK